MARSMHGPRRGSHRFSRTAGGTTTEFVYGAGGMALENQGGSYTQARWLSLSKPQANGLLRRGTEYPLFDGHGSERAVTNSSQTVTGSVNYEAFGQVAGSSGSSTNPYMYAGDWGYRNDGDARLMHVGARYYDAQVGRFITRDTVLSEHPYLYCEHEPVGCVDPSGCTKSWGDCWHNVRIGVGGVIGGGIGAGVGAKIGGLIGWIGGPVGAGIGTAVGAGTGIVIGYWWDEIVDGFGGGIDMWNDWRHRRHDQGTPPPWGTGVPPNAVPTSWADGAPPIGY